jgi:hypothetical protein
MAGGYVVPPDGQLGELLQKIGEHARRIKELEAPTGTQTAQALQQLTDLVNGLLDQENVTATNDVTAGADVNVGGYLYTPAGYAYDITYTRRGAWLGNDGRLGYASSSREKKANIRDAKIDPEAVLQIVPRLFNYKAELEKRAENPNYKVATEFGAIAEELHELGLWQVVIYDQGKPIGIHYEMLGLLAIAAAEHVNARVDELSARLDAAGL